ncbi:hypothetical protein GCM10007377_16080 [Galliscardovia ingluviei]|uniref:GmrSD restriction endonucleases C-terminal domain-containing protein n=1 Tax=Galliscardovia ingluviei TaxID=1769422 RepID=A0A8J3AMK0_9BIFI|nr:HNH endonuclease family protein [Galliscardovia ingluviei]GGI15474.1 hypothetical protein GCM10007377_16080 [Galliscardovia ingluviei]
MRTSIKTTITTLTISALTILTLPALAQADTAPTAINTLNTLTVSPQANNYSQKRDRPADWAQANNNPGDYSTTRDTILARDMTNTTYNKYHQVQSGTLNDPYTGKTINFQRTNRATGTGDSTAVQIDHVVAFGEAWESGLSQQNKNTINQYYNDPYVLIAVDGKANMAKSDKDAAQWLPSNAGNPDYNCYYVARQIGIKHKYHLSVDNAEKAAMEHVLASCPAITIPTEGGITWQTNTSANTGNNDSSNTGNAGNAENSGSSDSTPTPAEQPKPETSNPTSPQQPQSPVTNPADSGQHVSTQPNHTNNTTTSTPREQQLAQTGIALGTLTTIVVALTIAGIALTTTRLKETR